MKERGAEARLVQWIISFSDLACEAEFPRRPPKAFSDDLAFQVRDIIMQSTGTQYSYMIIARF